MLVGVLIVIVLTVRSVYYSSLVYQGINSLEQTLFENKILEYGYPNTEYLPLWDWEKESMGLKNSSSSTPRKCNPPEGIPRMCCVCAISTPIGPKWKKDACPKADDEVTELWTKEYMKKRMPSFESGDGGNGGRPCDVCEIVHILAQKNWTLALQGDSLTHQVCGGLVCEFARRGYPISVQYKKFKDTPENNGYSKMSRWENMTVTLSSTTNVTIRFYRAYRPTEYLLKHTLSENDIVVFDHGVHYPAHSRSSSAAVAQAAEIDMRTLLEFVQKYPGNRVKLLAWRETTAQHFANTPGGYFLNLTNPHKCSRINDNFTL